MTLCTLRIWNILMMKGWAPTKVLVHTARGLQHLLRRISLLLSITMESIFYTTFFFWEFAFSTLPSSLSIWMGSTTHHMRCFESTRNNSPPSSSSSQRKVGSDRDEKFWTKKCLSSSFSSQRRVGPYGRNPSRRKMQFFPEFPLQKFPGTEAFPSETGNTPFLCRLDQNQ